MKSRISQSVQKTLQTGKDLLFLLINDDNKVVQYSKQLMCSDTGLSYEEPSPNAFSFNSPYGACPVCKGLGTVYQVDMKAVLPDMTLSINDGGIAPLGEEREAHIFKQVQQVARKNKISLDKPMKELSQKAMNILLYGNEAGTGNEEAFEFDTASGSVYSTEFEGVVTMLRRWFAASSSESLRDWVENFMELKKCGTCEGTRLRKESLWFKIDNHNIAELSEMNLDKLMAWLPLLL